MSESIIWGRIQPDPTISELFFWNFDGLGPSTLYGRFIFICSPRGWDWVHAVHYVRRSCFGSMCRWDYFHLSKPRRNLGVLTLCEQWFNLVDVILTEARFPFLFCSGPLVTDLRPFRLDLLNDFAGGAALACVPLCFPGRPRTPPESGPVSRFADGDGSLNASPLLRAMRWQNRKGLEEFALIASFCCLCCSNFTLALVRGPEGLLDGDWWP